VSGVEREPVISLGAGTQSSALVLLADEGALDEILAPAPAPRLAVFADTGHEEPVVYRWLDRLEAEVGRVEIARTTAGDLLAAATEEGAFNPIPLHTTGDDGAGTMGQKQCTYQFKIRPIRALLRRREYGPTRPIQTLMGITVDEAERVKPSSVKWAENRYPLIELGMSRADCVDYVVERMGEEPPNSACYFCPLLSDGRHLDLRRRDPETWERAVAADEAMRIGRNGREQFVSVSRIPLAELAAVADRSPTLDLFQDECEGYCGV
jgi:hypothetical protein